VFVDRETRRATEIPGSVRDALERLSVEERAAGS
jgi:acyl-CoA thioesterase FadM